MHPIKRYATDNGITLKQIAVKIGRSAPYLTQIVKGHRIPSASVALAIEEATNGAVSRMALLYPQTNTDPGEQGEKSPVHG